MLPLDGITVVSCEQAVAGPLATRHLADLGARVIKIERPVTGDFARHYDHTVRGMSSHFVWLNRSKESLALDLKSEAAPETMARLLDRADVFLQNLAPGAIERLGFGSDELGTRFPHLVTCSISGYGTDGPYRDAKAYDLLVQSETGVVAVTGSEDSPAKAGIPVADISAGMYAFSGILAALYERERTGRGSHVDVSLFDSLAEWMGYPLYYYEYGGAAPTRSGTSHAAIAPYGTFTAGDGTDIVLSVQNQAEWVSLCAVLGDPSLATDARFATNPQRVLNRDALNEVIGRLCSPLTGEQFTARLSEGRIAFARRRELAEVIDHPQLTGRGRWTEVDSPVGPIRALLPPIGLDGRSPRMDPIPAVGEHTASILAEIGLSLPDQPVRETT